MPSAWNVRLPDGCAPGRACTMRDTIVGQRALGLDRRFAAGATMSRATGTGKRSSPERREMVARSRSMPRPRLGRVRSLRGPSPIERTVVTEGESALGPDRAASSTLRCEHDASTASGGAISRAHPSADWRIAPPQTPAAGRLSTGRAPRAIALWSRSIPMTLHLRGVFSREVAAVAGRLRRYSRWPRTASSCDRLAAEHQGM